MKPTVRDILETASGNYVSGQEIANTMNMTRANVWKEIQKLKEQGYLIDSVRNKGYALISLNGKLSKNRILAHIHKYPLDALSLYEEVSSTNTVAKTCFNTTKHTFKGLVVSNSQSEGRGRRGRQFFSPPSTGIYMSMYFTSDLSILDSQLITVAAAVSVRRVLHQVCNVDTSIKWLNDIYRNNRKICGILTEGDINLETGSYNYLVVGIGINLFEATAIPQDISAIYGYVAKPHSSLDRNDIIASIYEEFMSILDGIEWHRNALIEEYTSYSNVIGKSIRIIGEDHTVYQALDIDHQGYLVIQHPDGSMRHLNSGEISIKEIQA